MTPQALNPLTERAGAQPHFEDLCALLEVEPPREEILRRLLVPNLERGETEHQLEIGRTAPCCASWRNNTMTTGFSDYIVYVSESGSSAKSVPLESRRASG